MNLDTMRQVAELRRRVHGGFALVQALVGIRLRGVNDPESRRHLIWLADVVSALSLLNRRLDEGPQDFAGYLAETAAFWRKACEGRAVDFVVEASNLALPPSMTGPLALAVHELVAEAAGSAFPEGRTGRVSVRMMRSGPHLLLTVEHDGVAAAGAEQSESVRLAKGLAEHLGGSMEIHVTPSWSVTLRAPFDAPQPVRH